MRIVHASRWGRGLAVIALAAWAPSCTDFDAPPTSGQFDVAPMPSSTAADGSSIVTITAKIDSTTASADAHVAFATTVGTFSNGTAATVAIANGAGIATAQLKSPTAPGTAIVTVTFAGLTKTLQVLFTSSKGVTRMDPTPATAPADGASILTLRFTVDTSPRPTPASVAVSTTAGSLIGGSPTLTVPVSDSGFAYVKLRAPSDSTIASLTVTSAGLTRFFDVLFSPAPPDQVQLTASAFDLKAGTANSLTLTALLLRHVGMPSAGVTLAFSADTLNGTAGDFGQFSPKTTPSTSSSTTVRFTAGATAYHGAAVLRVRATRGTVVVEDSTTVSIVP